MRIKNILKEWTLLIAMVLGLICNLAFTKVSFLNDYKAQVDTVTSSLMPICLFIMLMFSFTSISPKDVKLKTWHLWNAIFQLACASGFMFLLLPYDKNMAATLFICFICPTATASAVITDKLKGNVATLISYILIINFVTSIAIPLLLPNVAPGTNIEFFEMVWIIMRKIFPLLVLPIMSAWLCRWLLPKVHTVLYKMRWISFYIWAFSLVVLIAGISDAIFLDGLLSLEEIAIMGLSLFTCLVQFAFGRRCGKRYGERISAGQALGQKNTIFAIWLATSFVNPVVALGPGSYIIWQNIVNSIELRRFSKANPLS